MTSHLYAPQQFVTIYHRESLIHGQDSYGVINVNLIYALTLLSNFTFIITVSKGFGCILLHCLVYLGFKSFFELLRPFYDPIELLITYV